MVAVTAEGRTVLCGSTSWPMSSKVNVGHTAIEVENSLKYSITFCCHVKEGSEGGSLTNGCLTWKLVRSKDVSLNSSVWKMWHPLTFIAACWLSINIQQ